MAAGERGHEAGHIGLLAQRQASQLQSGRPPFGARRQGRHDRIGQGYIGRGCHLLQQQRCLVVGEAQIAARSSTSCPRARSRASTSGGSERLASTRCSSGGRCSTRNSTEACTGCGADHVVVVEDQQHPFVTGLVGQLVDQRGHQRLEPRRRRRAEQRAYPPCDRQGAPGLARRPHGARTGPGRCPRHLATATPPETGRAGPSRPAGPSCRTRRGRKPAPVPSPVPHRAVRSAADGGPRPAAGRAHAAWWPAAHPALTRLSRRRAPRVAQPSETRTLSASSHTPRRCWKDP